MPVELHGKTYFTVAERLKLANEGHDPPKSIVLIETQAEAVGNAIVCHATVAFEDGRRYTGMSLVNADSRSPAERDAPLETAETSAVGRALAFAGYFGSPEGIAGAEEIALAQRRAEVKAASIPGVRYGDGSTPTTRVARGPSGPGNPDVGTAAPRPVGNPSGPSPSQVRFATKLWGDAGRPLPPPDFEAMTSRDVSALIDELKGAAAR